MLHLAAEVGIKYDNNLVPSKLKEGTIQPNGTDKIDVTTTYSQFKKKMTKVEPPESKETESDLDASQADSTKEVGSTLVGPDHVENNRRMKVNHKISESYEAAEAHKEKATAAQAKGDQEAYHHHMSNHHEALGKWHESKGRHHSAQISYDKAEEHHEASIKTTKVQKEEAAGVQEEPAGKHRIQVTVSDPNHTAVSKRKEQIQKHIRVGGEHSQEEAIRRAKAHYKKQGMKVHDAEHVGMVKEDLNEEHLVHVDDGSKYGDKPHPKDVEHVMAGVKKHNGEHDGNSDKGAFFKFKTHSDAKNFADHVKRAPHKSVYADLHEEYLEEATPYYNKASWIKKMSHAAKQERLAREKKEKEQQAAKQVKEASDIEEKEPENAYIQRGNVTEDVAEGFDPMFQPNVQDNDSEFSDKDIDDMVNTVDHEDDILDLYDDDEYILIDAETGEEIKEEVDESALNEVLSRAERMRAKMRFARTKSKRERRMMIALHSRSNTSRLNSRSRKMAIKLMKQRMAKKPLSQLSVGEKERIERTIQKRKAVIDRMAMKLAPRIRKIENDRLSHKKVTK
jgi:hypothetical protein